MIDVFRGGHGILVDGGHGGGGEGGWGAPGSACFGSKVVADDWRLYLQSKYVQNPCAFHVVGALWEMCSFLQGVGDREIGIFYCFMFFRAIRF